MPKVSTCAWPAKAMSTNSERELPGGGHRAWPLHSAAQSRSLESHPGPQDHSLMQAAGLASARLALALAPHARRIWIACGHGNNGGDGLEAARHLQQWGKQVHVSLLQTPNPTHTDTFAAWQAAVQAGVPIHDQPPADWDLCLDALFGLGATLAPQGAYADWIARMNAAAAPTLALDLPSGLDADTGGCTTPHVQAQATLSLLTLKPGLFTAVGRDACGDIWFANLGVTDTPPPQATLSGAPAAVLRPHASHKGSFGDVCVIGGAAGMAGAALLAARSALHAGAGRVFACLLDPEAPSMDPAQPELMLRRLDGLALDGMGLVVGCGGGLAIGAALPALLTHPGAVVLDADALNRIAEQPALQGLLQQRAGRPTVLTPHPLEAARLLECSPAQVQSERLGAAQSLAARYHCTVVLKGSGTVIAAPGQTPCINPTGNARLATAGSGDVLAGLIGALLAGGPPAFDAARDAVYRHGLAAERWPGNVLTAAALCQWA